MKSDIDSMKTARDNFANYLKGGGSDSSQIATYSGAIGNAVSVLATDESATFIEAYAVLTTAQKATLSTLNVSDFKRHGGWGRGKH